VDAACAYQVERVSFPPSDAYRKINPLGQVPFLEDEGGVAINESIAMLLYLAEKYGPTPLLPAKTDPRFARVLQMTVFGEATLGASMNPLLIDHFLLPPKDKGGPLTTIIKERVEQQVAFVETMLGDAPYLAGKDFTIADISVVYSLGLGSGLRQPPGEKLSAYAKRATSRPAYERATKA
jgi:glutathione S-transferase